MSARLSLSLNQAVLSCGVVNSLPLSLTLTLILEYYLGKPCTIILCKFLLYFYNLVHVLLLHNYFSYSYLYYHYFYYAVQGGSNF